MATLQLHSSSTILSGFPDDDEKCWSARLKRDCANSCLRPHTPWIVRFWRLKSCPITFTSCSTVRQPSRRIRSCSASKDILRGSCAWSFLISSACPRCGRAPISVPPPARSPRKPSNATLPTKSSTNVRFACGGQKTASTLRILGGQHSSHGSSSWAFCWFSVKRFRKCQL